MSALAPVALFTYRRPLHTKATLEALAANTLADQTDLVVFCDGAKGEADAADVAAVREIVRGIRGFASVACIERPANMGLAASIISGVSEVLTYNTQVIVLEDDLITSKNFIAYMNVALAHYRDDPKAFSVTGYTLPEDYLKIPDDYPFDTYAGYRCASWSWGTWRDRWEKVDWDMSYLPDFFADADAQQGFNRGGKDLTKLLRLQDERRIDSWAIRFCYAHFAHDMRCIYPTRTLVRNSGMDNSGVHCVPDPRFAHPLVDSDWLPARFCSADLLDERIAGRFRSVFEVSASGPARFRGPRRLARRIGQTLLAAAGKVRATWDLVPQETDVLLVNTYQKSGGAARAAWRLFTGLRAIRPQAAYLSLYRSDRDPTVFGLAEGSLRRSLARRFDRGFGKLLKGYTKSVGSFFSPLRPSNPFRVPIGAFSPKLVHLHWIAEGGVGLEELAALQCPVVWTLHDAWAFTGGCHYTSGCDRFQNSCGACPQLNSDDACDISHDMLRRKALAFSGLDLTIVSPSRWLADCAASSQLFAGRRIEVIPNGLDTDVFAPVDVEAARAHFGIAGTGPVILFGTQRLGDLRKGGDLLAAAIADLGVPCTVITFGEGRLSDLAAPNVTVKALGNLHSDAELALAYSAADMFVCPSREDNLPNTVAEAMACGTPCVAFETNGLPDMIVHQVDGWLATPFDPSNLAAGMRWIASHPAPEMLRAAARQNALSRYKLDVVAGLYSALFDDLIEKSARRAAKAAKR